MLPPGSYVVTEKSCDGYVIDEAQRIIELKPNEDAQFVFTNHIKPSLQLIKLSSDGSRLAGVTFRIAKIEDGSHYLDRTTNSNGEILISDLEPGVYSVRELSSVLDHIPDDTEHHVELFPGQTSTITLTNHKRPNLYIHKSDADTGEPIEQHGLSGERCRRPLHCGSGDGRKRRRCGGELAARRRGGHRKVGPGALPAG
ncbi:MAG: collagen binding domain-containing protein [Flavonifractor plautii]